jgi:ankyrin repeat protein
MGLLLIHKIIMGIILKKIIIQKKDIESANYLIKHSTNINIIDQNRNTLLLEAYHNNNMNIVNYLTVMGANVNVRDNERNSP